MAAPTGERVKPGALAICVTTSVLKEFEHWPRLWRSQFVRRLKELSFLAQPLHTFSMML
jgi:hypothetical protein